MIAFILSPIGRALLGLLFVAGLLMAAWLDGYHAGAASERQAILARSVEVLRERNATDDQIRSLDDGGLCRALGGRLSDAGACQ